MPVALPANRLLPCPLPLVTPASHFYAFTGLPETPEHPFCASTTINLMKKINLTGLSLLLLLASTTWLYGRPGPGKTAAKPNIVFILADDLGYTDLGCYGNPFNKTPHIDALARQGMLFTQAYAASPVCSPSRAAILTGKHPARLQLTNFLVGERTDPTSPVLPAPWSKGLPGTEVTLAELLQQQGYATGMVGKWHLGGKADERPTSQGFEYDRVIAKNGLDYYNYSITSNNKTVFEDDGKNYLTDKLTGYGLDFIEQHQQKPFFLYMAYSAPHVFIVPRADKLNKYFREYNKYEGKYNPSYAAMLESLDEGVGKIMEKLQALGLDKNTMVVFTSDNGGVGLPELGPTPTNLEPLRKWKGHVYEGGIRVPLLVKWPGQIRPGVRNQNYLTNTDYLPTFMELLGLRKLPAPIDGKSFLKTLLQPEADLNRGPVYWHYPHFSNQEGRPAGAIRRGDYKLVESYETGEVELFNLKEDLSESRNLRESMPQQTREMHHQLKQWQQQIKANMPLPNPRTSR